MPFPKERPLPRHARPPVTADRRRREVVDLIASHLARMPGGVAIPPPEDADVPPDPAPQISTETSPTGLEVPAK